jgi:hypothetical protein
MTYISRCAKTHCEDRMRAYQSQVLISSSESDFQENANREQKTKTNLKGFLMSVSNLFPGFIESLQEGQDSHTISQLVENMKNKT